jgi:bifunctional DNA-binding transcriptional regulator/antitoxin component of YhaV-PrlF toxin-antitoxin module
MSNNIAIDLNNIKQIKQRGVITLPPAIKEHLNVFEGDFLTFCINKDGSVEIKKVILKIDEKTK